MANHAKKTLEISIEYLDCPNDAILQVLTDAAMKVKALLEQATSDGPVELHNFAYSIFGDGDEEQAVISAEIWEITNEELDDLMHDVAAGHASAINNSAVEDQVRFLCRQLNGVEVIKALKEITEKRNE